MSSIDDDSTNTIDINVPTDSDGHPLNWDGNPAKILGLLDETGKHYTHNGLFAELISDRAVLTKHIRPSASLGSVTSRSLRVTPAGSTKTDMAGSPTVSYPPGLNLPYRKTLVTYQLTPTVKSSAEVTVNYPSKTLGDPRLESDSLGPPRGGRRSGRPLAVVQCCPPRSSIASSAR